MEIVGIVLFALGILISVCLHEAGHMSPPSAFGMKVTRYFVGFGPTLWSFRRGETEYGIKAIPLGGFVKIVGMTPQDDDVEPGDEQRAMWRYPVWKRTIVMSAGSVTHFVLGIVILWGAVRLRRRCPTGDNLDAARRSSTRSRLRPARLGGRPDDRPAGELHGRQRPAAARPGRRPAAGRPDHRGRRHAGRHLGGD